MKIEGMPEIIIGIAVIIIVSSVLGSVASDYIFSAIAIDPGSAASALLLVLAAVISIPTVVFYAFRIVSGNNE